MSEEDLLLLSQIERVKRNIVRFINPETIVDKIRELIEESDEFDFKNKRNSKYISVKKPLFILSFDFKNCSHRFTYNEGEEVDGRSDLGGDYDYITERLHRTVTSKMSDFIVKKLTKSDEFAKVLRENGINPDMKKRPGSQPPMIMNFLTAAIFGITIDLKNNTIYLEYVV